MTELDIILITQIVFYLILILGVTLIEGGYYELKLLVNESKIPALLKKSYNIISFKIYLEKLIFTIWRAALFLALVQMNGYSVISVFYTISIFLSFPHLHEIVYNYTRYRLGNDKYSDWWTYLSPSDRSLLEFNYRTRFPMFIISIIITTLQMIFLGVFN